MSFKTDLAKAQNAVKRFAKKTYPTEKAYIKFVQSRLRDNQYICNGMGSLTIDRVDLNDFTNQVTLETKFAKWLNDFEWSDDRDRNIPYVLPYMFNNKRILTERIQKQIDVMYEEVAKAYHKPSYEHLVQNGTIHNKNYAYMQYLFNGKVSKELIFKPQNLETSK